MTTVGHCPTCGRPVRYRSARPEAVYVATCLRCGKEVESATADVTCKCGFAFRMEWPGPGKSSRPATITDKYEGKPAGGGSQCAG